MFMWIVELKGTKDFPLIEKVVEYVQAICQNI